jgi:hypothetical protein
VPAVGNVRLTVPDDAVKLAALAGEPDVMNVMLCWVELLSLVHVTVPPRVIDTLGGENENTAVP